MGLLNWLFKSSKEPQSKSINPYIDATVESRRLTSWQGLM